MVGRGGLEPPMHEARDLQSPGIAAIRSSDMVDPHRVELCVTAYKAAPQDRRGRGR